ncbi:MAG TPA: type III polyketide synthase, partial [bacterium]|nr:type III polyketide synthase [bacterium]
MNPVHTLAAPHPPERAAAGRPRPIVLGWGTAVPGHRYRQAELAEHLSRPLDPRLARRLKAAFRGSRVETRHSVLPDFRAGVTNPVLFDGAEPTTAQRLTVFRLRAPGLAEEAARAALEQGAVGPQRVTHLLFVTCTGFSAPGPDRELVLRLGLSPSVRRVLIGFQGCSAGIVGLRTAAEIVRGDSSAVVLVVSCELSSLHFQQNLKEGDLRGHALFADGAGAAVVAASDRARGRQNGVRLELGAGSSLLLPDSERDMTWDVEDTGFRMGLSSRVPDALAAGLPAHVRGITRGTRVRHWAIHPGGPAILAHVAQCLGEPLESLDAAAEVLRTCGNMSSATIFFVLERMAGDAAPGDGVAMAFGPGLTVES